MATRAHKCLLGSPQVHIQMCEKHDLTIDMICEDCEEFICSQCAKTAQKDNDWKTINIAGRELKKKTLNKVKDVKKKKRKKKV